MSGLRFLRRRVSTEDRLAEARWRLGSGGYRFTIKRRQSVDPRKAGPGALTQAEPSSNTSDSRSGNPGSGQGSDPAAKNADEQSTLVPGPIARRLGQEVAELASAGIGKREDGSQASGQEAFSQITGRLSEHLAVQVEAAQVAAEGISFAREEAEREAMQDVTEGMREFYRTHKRSPSIEADSPFLTWIKAVSERPDVRAAREHIYDRPEIGLTARYYPGDDRPSPQRSPRALAGQDPPISIVTDLGGGHLAMAAGAGMASAPRAGTLRYFSAPEGMPWFSDRPLVLHVGNPQRLASAFDAEERFLFDFIGHEIVVREKPPFGPGANYADIITYAMLTSNHNLEDLLMPASWQTMVYIAENNQTGTLTVRFSGSLRRGYSVFVITPPPLLDTPKARARAMMGALAGARQARDKELQRAQTSTRVTAGDQRVVDLSVLSRPEPPPEVDLRLTTLPLLGVHSSLAASFRRRRDQFVEADLQRGEFDVDEN